MKKHPEHPTPSSEPGSRVELGSRVESWLRAERSASAWPDGRVDEVAERTAERALFDLFEALPEPVPSADFADRVLVAAGISAGISAGIVPGVADLGRRGRVLTAIACGLVACASLLMLPLVLALLLHVEPSALLSLAVQGFGGAVRGLVDLLLLGQTLSGLGRAFWLVATSPQVLAVVCLLGFLTLGLGRGLLHLIHSERMPFHARVH